MLNQSIARSLMSIIPNRVPVNLTLTPDFTSTTVSISNAWLKPLDVKLQNYGGVNLQGDETLIKVPDHELNPSFNGREIRPRDTIVVGADTYLVIWARITTVRTVWECLCRKQLP
jgi:hypothetical protein